MFFLVNGDGGKLNHFLVVLTPYLVVENMFVSEHCCSSTRRLVLSKPFYVPR